MIASSPISLRLLLAVSVVWNGLGGDWAIWANPVGPQIIHGSVSIDASAPANLRILQGSERAVIDWRSFSISAGEVTQFLQPGSGSVALNRVRGSESSLLEGSLRANGSVYLLNPNGVVVGKNGRIDAGGFIASSLDVDSEEFLRGGDLQFRGASNAPVINLGQIHAAAGDVFLIAPQVINEGTIRAPEGTAGLAAGHDVLLTDGGDERVFVRGASGLRKDVGVDQRGAIEASRAELKAHGGNLYALAIRNEGRVAATGVNRRGGQIYLSANGGKIRSSGTLRASRPGGGGGTVKIAAGRGADAQAEISGAVDASGEVGNGGRVEITGETVSVGASARVGADGPEGKGEIFVGGGERGRDPALQNAETVIVERGARLEASATERGDGGRIVVFANGSLGFEGKASVRGGPGGGDGGFVELSGKQGLEVGDLAGQVDVSAPAGRAGTLLIDPVSIDVVDGLGGGVTGATVTDAAINAFLATGNLVLANDVGGGGDIAVAGAANISWATAYDLSFQSDRDFLMNPGAVISGTGTGGVKVEAVRNAVIGGSMSVNTGNIEIHTDAIDLAGSVSGLGALKITPRTANQSIGIGNGAPGALNLTAAEIAAIQNGFNSITIGDPVSGSGAVAVNPITFTDPVTIASWNGGINVLGQITGTGDAAVTLSSSGPAANATFLHAPVVTNGNAVTILDELGLKGTSIDTTNGGLAPAGADVTIAGPVNADLATNHRNFVINAGSTGNIQINGAVGASKAVQDIDFQAATVSLAGAVTVQGNVTFFTDELSLGGAVSGPGLVTIAPRTAGTTIGIGDGAAGTLHLSTAELGSLQDGFSEVRIGREEAPGGPVEIRGGVFSSDLTVRGSSIGVTNLQAGSHRVSLLSASGGIADLGDWADDITAAAVRLTAAGSIGAAGDAIRLSHGAVVAAEATGGIFLDGSCDLTVGAVDGVLGLNSTVGDLSVVARGLLRVEQEVPSAGDQWFEGAGIWTGAELATTGGRTTLAIDDGGWNRGGLIDVGADVHARDGLFLRGGGGDDRFRFSLLPSSFPKPEIVPGHGGEGYDVLDFSPVLPGTPLEFDLATQPGLVDGIDHVMGTLDHRDRVTLPTFGAGIDVVLTGPNQFAAGGGEKSFASFEYLTGSSDPDVFTFQSTGQLSGGIDGAGGDDVIQGTSQADIFEILGNNAGTARGTSFVSVERVLGGAGDDRFNFRNQATLAKGIDGEANTAGDALLIDDSNLQSAQTYVITNGMVTRNPVYLFGGIEFLTLLAGQGNDDITADFQNFSQQISGGNGLDTIHVKDAVSKTPPLRLPGFQDIRLAGVEEVDAGAIPKVEDLVGRTGQENGGDVGNSGAQVTDQFSGKGGGGAPSLMGANGPGGGGLAGLIPGIPVPGGDLLQAAFAGVNSLVSRNFGIVSFNGGPPPSPKIRNEIINNTRNSAESELSSATTLGGTIEVDPYEGVSPMSSGASDAIGQVGTTSLEFSVSFAALAELGAALGLAGETGVGHVEGTVSMVLGDPPPRGGTQAALAEALGPESLSLLFLAIGGDGTVTIEPTDGILMTSIGVDLPGAPSLLALQGNTSLGSLMELVRVFGASGETALSGDSGPVTLDPSGIPPSAQLRMVLQVSNGVLAQHALGSALGMAANWTAGANDGAFQIDCSGSGLTPGQTGNLSNQLTPEARNELEGSFWPR